ncbi:MAG: site-specific integrase [Anaerolineae bacterium]
MNGFFKNVKKIERMKGGPLGSYLDSYAAQLHAEGYARRSARVQIRLIADFSRWLGQKAIPPNAIVIQHTADYLCHRKRRGYRPTRGHPAALTRLLKLLREQGVIARELPQATTTPSERWVEEFEFYLQKERALSLVTRINYRGFIQQFLTSRFGSGPIELSALCATDVTGFVWRQAAHLRSVRVQKMTTALRSFLRFARYRGAISSDLAACVPSVASWSLSALPRSLPPAQVEEVLAHCNRQTPIGRRDYAILLLLARLGLRSGEVARLTLEDIDWDNGYLTVQGKKGRSSQLPLPAEVGEAIADYVKNGRPHVLSNRQVFLRGQAPVVGFKDQRVVGAVVRRALARAGIDSPRKGAHQFRHTLATEMLKQGASLAEIGELLRHQKLKTTAIYAKVDLMALRTLALPWPGGVK